MLYQCLMSRSTASTHHFMNFTDLKYLGFSYITIAVCMGYKDKSYVNKKKDRIPKKIGLDMTFDEFLNSLKNKS